MAVSQLTASNVVINWLYMAIQTCTIGVVATVGPVLIANLIVVSSR